MRVLGARKTCGSGCKPWKNECVDGNANVIIVSATGGGVYICCATMIGRRPSGGACRLAADGVRMAAKGVRDYMARLLLDRLASCTRTKLNNSKTSSYNQLIK